MSLESNEITNEKKLLRKLDTRLLPIITLIYLLSFLDRVNLGNAKLANLESDLGLIDSQYNWALTGLFPGIIFYLTMWYKRSEQTYRISLFFSGATVSGAFSGLFAYLIVNVNFASSGWQRIFLIDGCATIFVAIIAYFGIPDFPETARWLTEEEIELAIKRLREDSAFGHTSRFNKDQILATIKDWKVWCSMFIFMGILVSYYSFSFFIPEIVNGLGFDPGKYTGTCLIGSGLCPSIAISISWLTNNLAGNVKRAVGSAMIIAWGNIGGIIAAQIYRQKDFPDYKIGHMIVIGFLLMSFILVNLQYCGLKLEKKKKVRNPSWYIGKNEEIKQMGDMYPRYVYDL
ncbi:6769_t:CDS:2 [Diversispora eburnea]|uniref:6769_t:CDS:1 n=1 Tax=Diversispora eburnea TaxID=1213867 RepID=A0A9N9G3I6_9GLOM|nr:6769_t:CDS:2 [Diversispora eburnea]